MMDDDEFDTYTKIVKIYIRSGTHIISTRDGHLMLYWLAAMGMHETLMIMGGVELKNDR